MDSGKPGARQQPLPLAAVAAKTAAMLSEVTVDHNLRFRTMQLKDAAAVFHLGEEVFHADFFSQLYRTWDAFEVLEMVGDESELCIIAEELVGDAATEPSSSLANKSNIVGFIFGSITEKRKREHSCGLLGWVGVRPSHQRRNIGTVMAHKLFQLFLEDGISLIVADTPFENSPAIRYLQRMGFDTPVYHVYMSLNLARCRQQRAQQQQLQAQATAPALPAEAKAVKLRPMSIDDLVAVHDLGEKIYDQDLYPNLYRYWSESEVVELFGSDSEFCQVAEYEGKVVGFVMGTTISKRRSSWRYGYLVWLGVAPEVQRFGVGKRLFNAFKELMEEEGSRIIMIDTQADNLPARRFFERAGFGSLEQHVYFSKTLGPDDEIASEERVVRQNSAGSGKPQGFKVTRLVRFKRSHSLMGRQPLLLAGSEAATKPTPPTSVPAEQQGDEDSTVASTRSASRRKQSLALPKAEAKKRAKRGGSKH